MLLVFLPCVLYFRRLPRKHKHSPYCGVFLAFFRKVGASEQELDRANARFREISEAHAILSDDDRRRMYDNSGSTESEVYNVIVAEMNQAMEVATQREKVRSSILS
jgi:curved DNA-binding protein CbpA